MARAFMHVRFFSPVIDLAHLLQAHSSL